MILTDLHSIIYVPPPGDQFGQLRFFHASLPDYLLDRSRSMDLFIDQGAAYAKFTGLAVKHINNPTESPLGNNRCTSFPSCCDFIDSMKMKTVFMAHFSFVVSKLIHPRSSISNLSVQFPVSSGFWGFLGFEKPGNFERSIK
jgi:hypothetical protein